MILLGATKLSTLPSRSADEIGLFAVGLGAPFTVAARRDDTAMTLERVAKHRFIFDAFRSSVEGRRQLLQRLLPPIGNEPQRIRTSSVAPLADLTTSTVISRRDVVVGLEIASGTPEAVQERFNDTRMTRFECRLPNRPDIATTEHKALAISFGRPPVVHNGSRRCNRFLAIRERRGGFGRPFQN